jgi:hypothetical protein
VTSDDPQAVREAIPWLAETYALLRKQAKAVPAPASAIVEAQHAEETPSCAVHQLPMVRVSGRRGPFWSCHERLPSGEWCNYRPVQAA